MRKRTWQLKKRLKREGKEQRIRRNKPDLPMRWEKKQIKTYIETVSVITTNDIFENMTYVLHNTIHRLMIIHCECTL